MARPKGFSHHMKAAHAAHKAGDHATANHHIGKMFALNRKKSSGMSDASVASAMEQEPDGSDPGEAVEMAMGEPRHDKPEPRGLGNWMQGAVKHPGALHRQLGIPQGKTIPAKTLSKAAHSNSPLLAKRARLAETFKKFRPK